MRVEGVANATMIKQDGCSGTTRSKAHKSFFPPKNAPKAVKEAWEAATDQLKPREIAMVQAKFMVRQIEENSTRDSAGRMRMAKPGEEGWDDIYGNTEASYIDLMEQLIHRIDHPLAPKSPAEKQYDNVARDVFAAMSNMLQEK